MVAAGRWHGRAAGAASGGSQVAPVRFPAPATAEAAWPGLRCQGRDLRPSPQVLNPPRLPGAFLMRASRSRRYLVGRRELAQ